MNKKFWKGKRVYVTGHTGFKGSWLVLWLHKLGAVVKGYSLEPSTNPSLFQVARVAESVETQIGDIRDLNGLKQSVFDFQPDIIIHMAAQPLVIESYSDPVSTYEINVMGTVNILEAARSCKSIKAVVNVTTDKCYQNNEWLWGYRENEPMGGLDPYSNSKGCSELISNAYRESFFNTDSRIALGTARAGNVIGGGDWAENRLIPDALRAFETGEPLVVRNPNATRPWQHVLEPLSGYLVLAENLFLATGDFSEGWNFGPSDDDVISVGTVLDYLSDFFPESAGWQLDKSPALHEAQLLKLDISKAKARLDWRPTWDLKKAIACIAEWHSSWLAGDDIRDTTLRQIEDFESSMLKKNI